MFDGLIRLTHSYWRPHCDGAEIICLSAGDAHNVSRWLSLAPGARRDPRVRVYLEMWGVTWLGPIYALAEADVVDPRAPSLGAPRAAYGGAGASQKGETVIESKAYQDGLKDGLRWDLDGFASADHIRATPFGWDEATIDANGVDFCANLWGVPNEGYAWEQACRDYNAGAFAGACAPQDERSGLPPRGPLMR